MGFWFMVMMLGLSGVQGDLRRAVIWSVVVFVSVMLHELGHALSARAFGARPSITLHALGGLTHFDIRFTRARSFIVALSGPMAGFLLGFGVLFATKGMHLTPLQDNVVDTILFVNIGWGIINLLPVQPFDGGHLVAAVLGPKRALATALISLTVGVSVAIYAIAVLKTGGIWLAFLFGTAAFGSYQQARIAFAASRDRRDGLEDMLKKAKRALEAGEADEAYALASQVATRAHTLPLRNGAYTALAWAHVARRDGQKAREALAKLEPRGVIDPYTVAAVEEAAGDVTRARQLLDEARGVGMRSPEMLKLHIDLYARDGRLADVARLTLEDLELLSYDDARAVLDALIGADEKILTVLLAARLFEVYGKAVDALDHARTLSRMGNHDKALDVLERLLAPDDKTGTSSHRAELDLDAIRNDPAFAPLVELPRFAEILG